MTFVIRSRVEVAAQDLVPPRGEQRTVGAVPQPIGALAAHPGRRRRPRHAPAHRQRPEKRQLPVGRPAVVADARRTMRIGRVVAHVPAWNIIEACRTGIFSARLRREGLELLYTIDPSEGVQRLTAVCSPSARPLSPAPGSIPRFSSLPWRCHAGSCFVGNGCKRISVQRANDLSPYQDGPSGRKAG